MWPLVQWVNQYLSFLLLVIHFHSISSLFLSSKSICHHDESLALIHFKSSFSVNTYGSSNDSQPKTETWKEGTNCCLWKGVTCDLEKGYVIELNLSSNVLYGPFHSNNSLFFLLHLQKLDLSFNNFEGSKIPSGFGKFIHLTYLNLAYSVFEGQVPSEISQLSNLVSLDLSGNLLSLETTTFSKLAQNLTKLRELSLSSTDMSLVAPNSFTNLSSLSILKLAFCALRGNTLEYIYQPSLASLDLSENYDILFETPVFSKLVRNLTSLRELDLSFDNLSLVSPDSLFNLSSLSSLGLFHCDLRGKFPDNFPNLISLQLSGNDYLILKTFSLFNKLEVIDLSGVNMSSVSLDSFMNLSSSLSYLSLSNCGLSGKFPGTVLQRPKLQLLELEANQNIVGFSPSMSNWSNSLHSLSLSSTKIPIYLQPEFVRNFNSLEYLHLSGCNFVGSNLSLLHNLTNLTVLDLSYNNFSKFEIPYSFGNLVKLTYLDISFCNFNGQIPSSLGNLKQLTILYIENNFLSGPIPNSLGNLTQLYLLDLANNQLTGRIPSQLSRLSNLILLILSNNLLSETIPLSLFTLPSLEYLNLHNNLLTGQIGQFQYISSQLRYIDLSNNKLHGPIPNSICMLSNLLLLDLFNNSLSGSIPKCFRKLSLQVLHLGMNYFNGSIPHIFSKGNVLRYLNFHGNELRGRIPSSIINCKNLEALDLGDNMIVDEFPFFLGALPELKVLVLRSNKLHGRLTNFSLKYSFPKLQIFDLSDNDLSGPLPSKYFDYLKAMMTVQSDSHITYMCIEGLTYDYPVRLTIKGLEIEFVKIQTILTTIDFSMNKFTGKIPKSIGELIALVHLNLSHNLLTSNIQPSLGNLINLESLDLSSNSLVGRIPVELVNLIFLQVFRVSNNQLEGPIPIGKQFNTFDSSSYEGNLGLCGFPLKEECKIGETHQQPNPPKEEISRSENGFGWRSVVAGYGCGVIFGFTIGYIIFRTRKRSWFVRMVEAEGYLWREKIDKMMMNTCMHILVEQEPS